MAQAELETEIPLMKEIIRQEPIEEVDLVEEDIVTLQELETLNENDVQDQNRYSHIPKPKKGWCSERSNYDEDCEDVSQGKDPYDNFMRKHLQHYGYFTGRNASFRSNYDGLENWHRNYDLRLSGTQSLSVAEEQLRKMGHHHHAHKNSQLDPGMGQFFAEGQPPDDLLSRTTQLVFHYQAGKKIPKLREPRNLYALTKEPGPQQATRWPSHMQVICSPIHFIDYIPPVPEPFYIPTGKELTPSVRGTPNGEIVFLNDPGRDGYFMRSRVAGCRLAMRNISVTPRESVDDGNFTLEFESRFESGNLLKVVKINNFEYELTLRPDVYTDKHTQWYFFRVRNMVPDETYRFTIVNLMKPSSLYNNGMKTLFYSEVNAKKSKIGWTRAGSDIRYYRNNLGSMNGRSFYSLTWTIKFPHKDDTCYFAHCYPYTYTDLQEYLLKLANDPVRSRFCKQRVLCRTLAGNLVYILTVTSPSRNPEIARVKKAVVLTARVHPGETNASWMMKGFLDFLSGNFADAKLLRDNFIFKIVPMLNPDGVIVGNYRCSLAGRDLNRNYKSVLKDSFPSVWHLKMMVKKLNMEREVILYCDLHGHSRKNNIFIYGCENKNNPQRKFRERIFPLMLAKNSGTKFSYESCKFKIQKSKEGTGRVVMWCMGIMNSYTMEATFGGTSLGSRKGTHFSTKDFEEMGHNFCDTLLDYCDPDTSKVDACYQEIQDRVRKQILKRMQMRNISGSLADVDIDDYSSEYESDTSGSDSSCDDGLPVHLLAIAPKLQRKRRLKTRRDRNKQTARKLSAPVLEEQMPTPIHGPKPVSEKSTKLTRYSHTAGGKRREDIIPSGSIGTVVQSAGYHNEGRVAKQVRKTTKMLMHCHTSHDENISDDGDKVTRPKIDLPPSMLLHSSTIKVPENMNLGNLINYNVLAKGKCEKLETQKLSRSNTDTVRLAKLNPKPVLQLFQHTMQNSLHTGKSIKIDKKQSQARLIIEQSPQSSTKNLPVIKEPERPPNKSSSANKSDNHKHGKMSPLMFWNHSSPGLPPRDHGKPKFPPPSLKMAARRGLRSEQELIRPFQNNFHRVAFRQNVAYVSSPECHTTAAKSNHLKSCQAQQNILNVGHLTRSRGRKDRQKIDIYEPKLALSLSTEDDKL